LGRNKNKRKDRDSKSPSMHLDTSPDYDSTEVITYGFYGKQVGNMGFLILQR
jgi:hypothetical protein